MKTREGRCGRRVLAATVWFAALLSPAPVVAQESAGFAPACATEQHRQFDFWVGEWEVDNRHRRPGEDDPTWYDTGIARDRVSAVLDGCAIVEHWKGSLSFGEVVGFSVRAFNPVTALWDLVLLWPPTDQPSFATLSGGFRHQRGEFFTRRADVSMGGTLSRFTFSDISPDTLRWDVAVSADSGLHWRPGWIMEFTRIGRAPTPVPADTVHRCEFPRIFELDFVLGWWAGTAVLADGRELPITVHAEPIVQGCGTLELIEIGDGDFKSLQVQTFEPGPQRWLSYRLDTQRPVLHRMDGSVRGASAQFEGTREYIDGESLVRRVWEYGTDDSLRTVLSESLDGGATWTDVYSANLTKRSNVRAR